MRRVAIQVQPLVDQRLADARLPVLSGKRAAPLVSGSRVEAAGQEPDEISDGLRLEDDRVDAWLDRLRLARSDCLANSLIDDVLRIEACEIEVIGGEVPRPGAICAAGGDTEPRASRSEVAPVAVGGGDRHRGTAGAVKAGAGDLRRLGRP